MYVGLAFAENFSRQPGVCQCHRECDTRHSFFLCWFPGDCFQSIAAFFLFNIPFLHTPNSYFVTIVNFWVCKSQYYSFKKVKILGLFLSAVRGMELSAFLPRFPAPPPILPTISGLTILPTSQVLGQKEEFLFSLASPSPLKLCLVDSVFTSVFLSSLLPELLPRLGLPTLCWI